VIGKLPYISSFGIIVDSLPFILFSGPNGPTLTWAHVHVRHINYNDFLPLMLERDLNYRYLLPGLREKEWRREREKQSEMRRRRGPVGVITGCAWTFQESDSRHNSRVTGQSCLSPPPPPPPFFFPIPSASSVLYHFAILVSLSMNRSSIDSNWLRFGRNVDPWWFRISIGRFLMIFLFLSSQAVKSGKRSERNDDTLIPWQIVSNGVTS